MSRLIILFLLLLLAIVALAVIGLSIIKRIAATEKANTQYAHQAESSSDSIILIAAVIALLASITLFFLD